MKRNSKREAAGEGSEWLEYGYAMMENGGIESLVVANRALVGSGCGQFGMADELFYEQENQCESEFGRCSPPSYFQLQSTKNNSIPFPEYHLLSGWRGKGGIIGGLKIECANY